MAILGSLRRYLAHKLYTPPNPPTDDGGLSTRGVCEYALDTRVKRDVIRDLAYHMGTRKYYDEEGGLYGINAIGEWAVYDEDFPVSTDMTDYDTQDEYIEVTWEAKQEHIVECLREAVQAKILEFGIEDGYTDDHTIEYTEVHGVRPGPRFEFAVQSLLFIDRTTDSMNRWETSLK